MAHISGDDRSQQLPLADAVDDWVGADNPVRFIDAFVDGFDLERAGFERVQANRTGRPGYDTTDLLKQRVAQKKRGVRQFSTAPRATAL